MKPPGGRGVTMAPILTVLAGTLVVLGCYQSVGEPTLDGAPAAVQQRVAVPMCGRVLVNYVGATSDDGAAECYWQAYLERRPAEYQFFIFSDAGEQVSIYRIEPNGDIVHYFSGDPEGWVMLRCGALEDYRGDPNMFGPGFLGIGCSRTTLRG